MCVAQNERPNQKLFIESKSKYFLYLLYGRQRKEGSLRSKQKFYIFLMKQERNDDTEVSFGAQELQMTTEYKTP